MISLLKRKIHIVLIVSLWIVSVVSQFIWLKLERLPPLGDGIRYLLRGMEFFGIYSEKGLGAFCKEMFKSVDALPPSIEITYFLYYKLFGISTEMELMVNSIYLGIGIIGVYCIAKYLFNKNTGLLAALIFTSFPAVLVFSRLGFREFHIMCSVVVVVYFLLRTENFSNRKFSVLFGISMGILLLIKYVGLVFIGAPISTVLIGVIYKRFFLKKISKGLFFNMGISLFFFCIIGLPWYIVNLKNCFIYMQQRSNYLSSGDFCFSTNDLFFYSKGLFNGMLPQVYFLLFIVTVLFSFFVFIGKKNVTKDVKNILLVCFYLMIPFLFYTFFGVKDLSHILPLLPFIGIVVAGGYNLISGKLTRKIVLLILIFFHMIPSHIMPFLKVKSQTNMCVSMSPIYRFICKYTFVEPIILPYFINTEKWDSKIKGIIEFIKNDYSIVTNNRGDSCNKSPTVLLLANSPVFRYFQVEYYNIVEGKPIKLISIIFPIEAKLKDIEEHIFGNKYDYLLVENTDNFLFGKEDEVLKDTLSYIRNNGDKFDNEYRLIGRFILPGEPSMALVYKIIN